MDSSVLEPGSFPYLKSFRAGPKTGPAGREAVFISPACPWPLRPSQRERGAKRAPLAPRPASVRVVSLTSLKLVLLLLTLAAGWVGAALPLLGRRETGRGRWIGVGNAFAAGLFLGVGLLHFLPAADAGFADGGIGYPLAPTLALAAFLLLLLLEHVLLPDVAHDAAHAHSSEGLLSHAGHDHSPAPAASPYVLVIALSAHSVLAGLALGADPDRAGTLLSFLAIAVHKGSAGLALGMALASSAIGRARSLRLATVFALMTPLGIGLGMAAGGGLLSLEAAVPFEAGVLALAAGTFLYIGAFDLLQDEFLQPGRRWAKWVSAVAGVLLASALVALA